MSNWTLPTSLEIGGVGFSIRSDFRDILNIISAYNDPDLPIEAKHFVMLQILYEDFESMKEDDFEEALRKGLEFIDCGQKESKEHPQPSIMDWEQDSRLIVSAINKVSGCEIRALPYLHWWTFLSYYMEIGEGLYSSVLNIRYKRLHGKKLDKSEQEFERDNRDIVKLRKPESEEEIEQRAIEREALNELLGL